MPKYVVVNRESHSLKRWKRPDNARSAAQSQTISLVATEAASAASEMPIGFVPGAGKFELASLVSVYPGENAYVGPDGKWIMRHKPISLRGEPFQFARMAGTDRMTLCVDEESEFFGQGEELFFEADGSPSPALNQAFKFHHALESERAGTALAVAALAESELIMPWKIELKVDQQRVPISGFYRVDEEKLDKLSDESFLKLRKAHAIALAYVQLISMNQLLVLQRLTELQKRARNTLSKVENFLNSDEGLIF